MLRGILVACLLGVASPALADATVVVLGIRSIEGDDEVANDVTQQLRVAARGVAGWRVSDRAVSMAQMSLAHGCDEIDAICLNDIATGLKADGVIYGTMRRTSARDDYNFTISLGLFNAAQGTIAKQVDATIDRNDLGTELLAARAATLISRLSAIGGGGQILIQVANVDDAEVAVNGRVVGRTTKGSLRLEGMQDGQYRIEISKTGFATHESVVSVANGGTTNISATLATGDSGVGDRPWEDGAEPARDGASSAWLGWTLVGVGAASLIMSGVSMFIVNDIDSDPEFDQYRDAVARGNEREGLSPADIYLDVCDAAADNLSYRANGFEGDVEDIDSMCEQADTFEVLQWVFLGTGLVAGGVGAFILLDADDEHDRAAADRMSLALTPHVGRDRAMLSASLRF